MVVQFQAAGKLVFHVFGTIAQFECWLISERTKGGLETARKHGRNLGRPPLQPETISAMQDLVEAGKSVSQAAKHLGIGRSTAYKRLRNLMSGLFNHEIVIMDVFSLV